MGNFDAIAQQFGGVAEFDRELIASFHFPTHPLGGDGIRENEKHRPAECHESWEPESCEIQHVDFFEDRERQEKVHK